MWAERESVEKYIQLKSQLLVAVLFTFESEDKARYCGDETASGMSDGTTCIAAEGNVGMRSASRVNRSYKLR